MPTDLHATMQNTRHHHVLLWTCSSGSAFHYLENFKLAQKKEVQDVIIIDPGSVELCRELRKDLCQA